MEDNTTVPPEYQKRFNEGYTIAKYMPELAQQLTEAIKDKETDNGFQDGHRQFLSEQVKDKLPSWLSGNRPAQPEKQPDKNKDRGIEPEPN
jgi:non-homologous end joining protein Ku